MKHIKFLHCADIHLDMPFSSIGPGQEKPSERRLELRESFSRIIDIASDEQVDLLLISGDLYEHFYVKKSSINYINDRFRDIEKIRVVIIPGNHDLYTVNSYYANYPWSENVHILRENMSFVHFEDISTYVYGIGLGRYDSGSSIPVRLKPADTGCFNILMAHGTVDMGFSSSAYNSFTSDDLSSTGMDYIAMGHFHKRIERIGGKANVYNPGSLEPLGFDEEGEHGVYIGSIAVSDSKEKSLDVRFRSTGKRFYENVDVFAAGLCSDEHAEKCIIDALRHKDTSNGLFCISLKGYTEPGFKVDVNRVQSLLKDYFYYIKVKDETIPDYDFEEISKEPGLRGSFTRKVFSLIEGTGDEYEKKMLQRALYYGIEALDTGKVDINRS